MVHHDLRTAPTYFDQVLLLNMRLVASGPIDATYTPDNLQKTFGARLDVLETAGAASRLVNAPMISFNTVVVLVSTAL